MTSDIVVAHLPALWSPGRGLLIAEHLLS